MKDSHDKRRELERYQEIKRLAEIIWPTVTAIGFRLYQADAMSLRAWEIAESMYLESERRRPQE
jgi:hypothetical protein